MLPVPSSRRGSPGCGAALVLAATLTPAGAAEAAAPSLFHELPVPGGRTALAREAGLDPGLEPWRAVMDVIARVHLTRAGRSPAPQLEAYLNGAPDSAESVPSPLALASWQALLKREVPANKLLAALLADHRASLLYHGLMSVDEPTLGALVQDPETLDSLYHERASAFAVFSGALSVHDGAVQVPGGAGSRELWEELVREPVARPAAFIQALFDREEGRLAFFFDSVARLDPASQRFALAESAAPDRRADRFRALWSVFAACAPWWDASRQVSRPEVDASRVLIEVRVGPEGSLSPPASQALWRAALAAGPLQPVSPARLGPEPADAAWLVEQIAGAAPGAALERLAAFRFGQRVLAAADPSAPDTLQALRGFIRYPGLLLSLERIGIRDPALLSACVRHAQHFTAYPLGPRTAPTLIQFQGALALVERARVTQALDAPAAESLVRSLLAVATRIPMRYYGRMAEFLDRELLPALAGSQPVEEGLLRALVGEAPAERQRFAHALRRLDSNPLDHVLDFCRSAQALADAPQSPEALRAYLLALEESAQGLSPVTFDETVPPVDAVAVVAKIRVASETVPEAERLPLRLAQPAILAGESLLAETLSSLLYAVHMGPADGPLSSAGSVHRRHSFGLGALLPTDRDRNAWRLPRESPDRPWHVEGALMGLDVALAPFAVRRLSNRPPDAAPVLTHDAERVGFAQSVALLSPFALSEAGLHTLAASLRRGRERVAEAGDSAHALDALAGEARVPPWRRHALVRLATTEPAEIERFFTLAELRQLGADGSAPDAWGVPDLPAGGLQPRMPPLRPWSDLLGSSGRIAPRLPDMNLRVAEALAERRLPARVLPAVLAFAVQDLLDELRPATSADGDAAARYARDVPGERIESYLAALAAEGVLDSAGSAPAAIGSEAP